MSGNDLLPLDAPAFTRGGETFLAFSEGEGKVSVRYFRRRGDGRLLAMVRFGERCQGPPGAVHGGAQAAVLDEAMGAACWMAGFTAVGARLNVRFRRGVPTGSDVVVEAWVEKPSGRSVRTRAVMLDGEGNVLADASGTFLAVAADRFAPGSPGAGGD